MTVNEIVEELRAGSPRASDALRLQVMTHASQPAPQAPSLLDRLRGGRRLALLVPAGAALAVVAAVAIGVTRSGPPSERAATAPETIERSAGAPGSGIAPAAPGAAGAATAQKAAPAPFAGRAQHYAAALTLQVEDTDALSDATQRALAVARDLGGYVVSIHYATGEDGAASMTLRVPSTRAAEAVTRLSNLGTILAQDVQIDDLQESLDALDRRLERLQTHIAALTAAIDRADGDAERAKGLLMEREGLTERDAFTRLRKASQISGRPLKVVAEALIATLDAG